MNAPRPLFPTAAKVLLVLSGCALLAGCVNLPFGDNQVDPTSPVAAEVTRRGREGTKTPTFASIPNAPKDVRPAPQYGQSARRVIAAGDALTRATEPGTWTLSGTNAFAEKARRDAGPSIEPGKAGDAEAFARELRERATPPPPR